MRANVYSLDGKIVEKINLPSHFNEDVRLDLIRKSVHALQSHKRQPYGVSSEAGKNYVIKMNKRRRIFGSSYGMGQSRTPRKVTSRIGDRFVRVGAFAPQTVGGRRAHPPKVEKNWKEKINVKENRKAIRSAIAATGIKELVERRNHKVNEVPIIVVDDIENLKKTKDIVGLLEKIGLKDELERGKKKKIRAGKGKMRNRKYKKKKSILFVVSKKCELMKSVKNIPGVNIILVKDLNTETLAPGGDPGRLTIWSKSAIENLEGLFK